MLLYFNLLHNAMIRNPAIYCYNNDDDQSNDNWDGADNDGDDILDDHENDFFFPQWW